MKIQRFNTISSLPGVMKTEDYVIPSKIWEKSIVDKSCFVPLDTQLQTLTPMTASEQQQHYDFVNGKDDGRAMPLHRGADISELQEDVRNKQEAIKKKLDKAAEEIAKEAEHKALQESVRNDLANTTK